MYVYVRTPYEADHGRTWSDAVEMKVVIGDTGSALHHTTASVWPQLKLLSNGVLVLASGRPGIGFWLSSSSNPGKAPWIGYDVQVGGAHTTVYYRDR